MSAEPLRGLLTDYENIVTELNKSIDNCTQANNNLAIAKAEVAKNKHKHDLIQEQIRCEKALIKATQ